PGALGPAGRAAGALLLPARGALVQLPGAQALQGEVRSRLGAPLHGLSPSLGLADREHDDRGADRGGVEGRPRVEGSGRMRKGGLTPLILAAGLLLPAGFLLPAGMPEVGEATGAPEAERDWVEETINLPGFGKVDALRPEPVERARGVVL